MISFGPERTYIYELTDGCKVAIRVRVSLREIKYQENKFEFSFEVTPSESDLNNKKTPDLQAFYYPLDRKIVIENISRGDLSKGQRLTTNTFRDLITLAPDAKFMHVVNITHPHTLSLVKDALEIVKQTKFDSISSPGPIVQALLDSHCTNIKPFQEGKSCFVGLKAEIR